MNCEKVAVILSAIMYWMSETLLKSAFNYT